MDHRTILGAVERVRASGDPATALSIARELGVDDEELLEDIGEALQDLVDSGRLRRVETYRTVAGVRAPFPTVSFEPADDG